MQFSHSLIVLVAAGLANAQGLPNLPPCSLNCFVSALGNDGCTPLTNFACHCQVPGLAEKITPCVKDACDVAAQSSVSSIVVSQCSAAKHPITLPPVEGSTTASGPSQTTESALSTGAGTPIETGTATGAGSASESPSGSASGSGSGSMTGSGGTSPTGGSGGSSSSVPVGSSSAMPSGSSGGSGGSGSGASPTGSEGAGGSSSPSGTSNAPLFSGAASSIKSNMAGVVAVAAAAVYAL
ncbi:hypothetical protein PHISCL_08811 [Aspergillus sclerotialis]|uniref:CFEM domain-containing protein n=1 Tax=Aspergillus sclerotialis TaxID=2070753 RepID=A0A3A2ZLU5_9EURO|nr:hypothetical protein PHISCL_08811 [Aspergillus sclerotialis]